MIKLTLLEANYIKDTLEEQRDFLEDQFGADQDLGGVEDAIENSLEIIVAGLCNSVIDEEIPMSIESWQNPLS